MGKDILFIAKEVAQHYGITLNDINKKSRLGRFLVPRQIAHSLCYDLLRKTKTSNEKIGIFIGSKTPATVLNSKKVVRRLIKTDDKIKSDYEYLRTRLEFKLNESDPKLTANKNLRKQKNLISARSASIRHKMPLKIQLIVN